MIYRNLGKSGLMLSSLSYGSWVTFKNQVNVALAEKLMGLAYDFGVNFFDNAEVYAQGESERIMGKSLQNLSWSRDSFCISSKVFWGGDKPTQKGLSRKHIFDACHAALKRMKLDYLDLYFCHRPDPSTPMYEIVSSMDTLIRQGKVLYWGTSEWEADQIMEAQLVAREWRLTPPTMEQPEYNLFKRDKIEKDYNSLYETYGLGTTIWSPLCSGLLSKKYFNGIPKKTRMSLKQFDWLRERFESKEGQLRLKKIKKLSSLAEELDISLPQLAIAWCLKNKRVSTVILGASTLKQLKENLESYKYLDHLSSEVMEKIEKIIKNKPEGRRVYK